MYRNRIVAALLAAALLISGCASTGAGDCRAPIGSRALTPGVVAAQGGHQGEAITWGGTLVSARNLADATDLEVLAYPLDDCGRPLLSEPPQGRFIIRHPGYLETADLAPGRPVTASGRIIATLDGRIGETDYRFPVLEDAAPRVWSERRRASGYDNARVRPWISVGVGGGRGWSGGGVGVWF